MMGGFLAPEMKYAGYDKIILSRQVPRPRLFMDNNDKVEIRDASHLRGKGAVKLKNLFDRS